LGCDTSAEIGYGNFALTGSFGKEVWETVSGGTLYCLSLWGEILRGGGGGGEEGKETQPEEARKTHGIEIGE